MSRIHAPVLLAVLATALACASGIHARLAADEASPDRQAPDVAALVAGLASEDREKRQASAEAACEVQHPDLLPALLKAAKDEYRSVREPVWKALGARSPQPEKAKAARAVETRLRELDRKPESPEEVAVVVQALHDLAQRSSIDPLLEGLGPTTEAPLALARLRAVANVPDKAAIEALLNYAQRGRGGDAHRAAARQALTYATGLRLANLDAWLRWWSDAKRTWDPDEAAAARAEQASSAEARKSGREGRRERPAQKPGGSPEGEGGSPPEKPGKRQEPEQPSES